MEEVNTTMNVAKGISDFGMMAVVSAFYLVITAVMMVIFIRWFVKIVNNILDEQKGVLEELAEGVRSNSQVLEQISAGLTDKLMGQVETVATFCFELSIEQVAKLVQRVKDENNIDDKEGTRIKIKSLLTNLHDERNSKLDYFTYSGKSLSHYTEDRWIDDIAKIVEKEVYNKIENKVRTYSNIKMAYRKIKNEFYKNLKNK